jgi:predicted RNA methylase
LHRGGGRNLETFEFDDPPAITFYEKDVKEISDLHVDTVMINPPFGTRNKGIDLQFLKTAGQIATGHIFSFHKTSTRHHVLDIAAAELGLKGEVMMEVDFNLKKLSKFHKVDSKPINVDVYHFTRLARRKS